MAFQNGDRVRILQPKGEYTGCRGTIADGSTERVQGVLPLGHMVAIDGENGIRRPFLIQHLEPLQPARVRRPAAGEATDEAAESGRAEADEEARNESAGRPTGR